MKLTVDQKLADQLEFVRQGEFEEVDDAPTLRLVGDVKAVDADGEALERIEELRSLLTEFYKPF